MAHTTQPPYPSRPPCPTRAFGFAVATAAGLFARGVVEAQTPQSGDDLYWVGGTTNSSWTSPNLVWNDQGGGAANPVKGPVSLNSTANQALTYGFFFVGNSPTVGTVAPSVMSIDQALNANFISFLDGFAANNTTTIGRSANDGLSQPLNLVSGWAIADRGVGGTVTFNQYAPGITSTGPGGLFLNLRGAGTVTAATGANVVFNTNLVSGTGSTGSVTIDKPPTDNAAGGVVTFAIVNNNGNTYPGGTTVHAGTLVILGGSNVALGGPTATSATGYGAVTVNSGGTFAGNGVAIGNTTVDSGGLLAPGTTMAPIGKLQLGSNGTGMGLTLNGTLNVDIIGGGMTAGVNNDQVSVAGNTTLNPASSRLSLNLADPAGLKVGAKFFILLDSGALPVTGTFANLLQGATVTDPAGDTYTVNYLDNGDGGTVGNDISLTVTNVVPEPATWAMLAGGLGALVLLQRRRRRTA